jgi:hypothetical protein
MEWRCRQEIEDALWSAARKQLPASAVDRKRLLQAIVDRSELYTSERQSLATARASSFDLAARALFFGVADAAKISIPLAELANRNCLPAGDTWEVLDLGGGAGAMGLGIASYLADRESEESEFRLRVDAVDTDADALALYEMSFNTLRQGQFPLSKNSEIRCVTEHADAFDAGQGRYDLVVIGSMLNELSEIERESVASKAMSAVRPAGSLIMIEPALRQTSRWLHELRDFLIGQGKTMFAPCTQSLAPCPALQDPRDWCHEDRAGVLPNRSRQLSQATGLRDGGLKFSYLVARHADDELVACEPSLRALRVVSQPKRGKGQRECFVCGVGGRQRARLLKRNRNSGNRLFERARRGDVLLTEIHEGDSAEQLEIARNQTIELLRPAD